MNMKKIIATFFAVVLLAATPASAQDSKKGKEAYDKKDYATAYRIWKPLAEQGNPNAQVGFGDLFYHGYGVEINYQLAKEWYLKSAEQGHAQAQNNLGVLYTQGKGVAQDYAEAIKWYRKSAMQGHMWAQSNIGTFYANGTGVPQDNIAAYAWFYIAVQNGNSLVMVYRKRIAQKLSPLDIIQAQALAKRCLGSNYRDCP